MVYHNDPDFMVCIFHDMNPKVIRLTDNSFSFKITTVTFTVDGLYLDAYEY